MIITLKYAHFGPNTLPNLACYYERLLKVHLLYEIHYCWKIIKKRRLKLVIIRFHWRALSSLYFYLYKSAMGNRAGAIRQIEKKYTAKEESVPSDFELNLHCVHPV